MRKLSRKWKLWGLFFVLMFFAAGATVHTTATDVQAATKNGFKTEKGKSYYYQNGQKVKYLVTFFLSVRNTLLAAAPLPL